MLNFSTVCVSVEENRKLVVRNAFYGPDDVELISFVEKETFESFNEILARTGQKLVRAPGRHNRYVVD